MRKCLLAAVWAFGVVFMSAAYAGPSAMVVNVAGTVVLDTFGKESKVQAFSRLLEGDRVKLGADARLTLVYTASGRQETWSGAGTISAGDELGAVVAGNPKVETKQLPRQVAQQMARTPVADASGKAGMVRMRAIGTPEAVAALEQKYRDLRAQAAPEDRGPEVFLLAGLFEKGAYDRLEEELARIGKAYPEDDNLQALARIYVKAVADARQTAGR